MEILIPDASMALVCLPTNIGDMGLMMTGTWVEPQSEIMS